MNIIFHVQGSLRRNEEGLNYYGGKHKLRHFEDTACWLDIRQTACDLLGESGTCPQLRYAAEDILCELSDGLDFCGLQREYKRSKGSPMEIYVLSSYGKNEVSTKRTPLGCVTPVKSCEISTVLTPDTVDCLPRKSTKRPRQSSVARNLNLDRVVCSQSCPSEMHIDEDLVISFNEQFDSKWFSCAEGQLSQTPFVLPLQQHKDALFTKYRPEDYTLEREEVGSYLRSAGQYGRQPKVNFQQAYLPLLQYFDEVSDVDNEAVSVFDANNAQKFHGVFWTYGQLIHAYQNHLRKVVIIDVYPLDSTRGCLLTALGVDPDNRTFPLAFALVETETEGNWRFFFRLLKQHVLIAPKPLVIQTPRHTVITKWITKYFPDALHVYCPFHLFEMISRKCPMAADHFREAYTELDEGSFSRRMLEVRGINEATHDDLVAIGYEKWADLYISRAGLSRFSINTFNHRKSWHRMMHAFADQPLPMLVQCIRTTIARHFFMYKARAATGPSPVCRTAAWMLEAQSALAIGCTARPTVGGKFMVNSVHPGSPHTVDMVGSTCTCNLWQINSLPCAHALACLAYCGPVSPYDLVSKCYSTSTLRAIYSEIWTPTRSVDRVPIGLGCLHCVSPCPRYVTLGIYSRFDQAMDDNPNVQEMAMGTSEDVDLAG